MSVDLKNLKPVAVSTNPASYSMLLMGLPKSGKSTFVHDLYGDDVLFLATEKRFGALEGAFVQYIGSWSDFLVAVRQLKQPELQDQFKVVCIDTADSLFKFCEKYVATTFGEKNVGSGDVGYGKDFTLLGTVFFDGLKALEATGYTLVFTSHVTQVTKQVPVQSILPAQGEQLEGAQLLKDDTGQDVVEYQQYQPSIGKRGKGTIENMVDNILFIDTSLDSNGLQQQVIHLRETLQWEAGTTFKEIPNTIPFGADSYREAIKTALSHYTNTTEERTGHAEIKESVYNFDDEMNVVRQLAGIFNQNGAMDDVTTISESVLGKGGLVTTLPRERIEDLVIIRNKMEERLEELGLVATA